MIDETLKSSDFTAESEPYRLFEAWLADATKSEPNDPTAMTLATVDESGMPDARMVLLKGFDPSGFVFFTNFESAKGQQLLATRKAALCFHWKSLRRQVRISGKVEPASDEEADAYFSTRAKDSQIGAWASEQSRPMEGRFALEKRIAMFAARYGLVKTPRPPHWRGWRVVPTRIEFWRDRPFRLHDRLEFTRGGKEHPWTTQRLYP